MGFDGGSMLHLGDSLVMNNDGVHGGMWRVAMRNLTQGEHPLVVVFFEDTGAAVTRWASGSLAIRVRHESAHQRTWVCRSHICSPL